MYTKKKTLTLITLFCLFFLLLQNIGCKKFIPEPTQEENEFEIPLPEDNLVSDSCADVTGLSFSHVSYFANPQYQNGYSVCQDECIDLYTENGTWKAYDLYTGDDWCSDLNKDTENPTYTHCCAYCPKETHYCPISKSCISDSTIEQGLQWKLECPYITLSWDKDEKAISYEIIAFYDENKDEVEDGKCEEDISNTKERYFYYNLESSDCAGYYTGNVRFQIIPQYPDSLSIDSYNTEWIDVSICNINDDEEKDNFCENYYGGKAWDGLCFTDFEKTPITESSAEKGVLKYTPYGSNVERVISYPNSIKGIIKDNINLNFKIDITLINHGEEPEKIKLNDFKINFFNSEESNVELEETVNSGETKKKSFNIEFSTPDYSWIPLKEISFSDSYYAIDFGEMEQTHVLPRILLYWENDYYTGLPLSIKECGDRRYNENSGVCKDDIFFPSMKRLSCISDEDCQQKYSYSLDYQCFEYSCLNMGSYYMIGPRDKEYKVGILPLYITDSNSEYIFMKSKVNPQIDKLIPKMTSWFEDEKDYWNSDSKLSFKFNKVGDGCRMTFSEFRQIHPVDNKQMTKSELKQIEQECVTEKDYDILIVSIQREDYFDPEFKAEVGINHKEIIASSLSLKSILHELLHSFGEHDIYGLESFQWANCYLYNAFTSHEWEDETPHLCKFEAMQLGLIPKFPS